MSNTVSRLTIAEDAWERREKSRLEDEQEELNKRKVEEFRRIKTATPMPEGLPVTLPGGSRLDTTPAVTVLDMLAPNLGQQEGYDYETDEEEFGGREDDQDDQEDAMDQYETDEEEFDPGPTSNGLTSMQQVNLGQSNRSPGDTLEYKSECPQVQDEHPCMKAESEEDDEHCDGVRGTEVHYETDEDEFEREEEPVILPGGEQTGHYPGSPCTKFEGREEQKYRKEECVGSTKENQWDSSSPGVPPRILQPLVEQDAKRRNEGGKGEVEEGDGFQEQEKVKTEGQDQYGQPRA